MSDEKETAPTTPAPAFRIEGDRATLFGALVKARAAFKALANNQEGRVEKDGKLLYTYDYADLANVQDATSPALANAGLVIMQPWWSDGEGYVSSTMLVHVSGAMMATETWFKHPGTWQQVGSALSYIQRYQWRSILGISASKDDDDGARATNGAGANNGNGQQQRGARPAARQLSAAPKPAPRPVGAATDAQITDILEVAGELGLDSPGIESFMQTALGYTCGSNELSVSDAKKLLEAMVSEQNKRAAS